MTKLSDDQKAQIARWVEEGTDLNGIQDRLQKEFEMTLSFMDTRFLISDLGFEIKAEADEDDEEEEESTEGESPAVEEAGASNELTDAEAAAPGSAGGVSVTMDTLCRPGMVASGQVTFSDGKKAGWYFDEMGRLGVDPDEADYRPSEEDLVAFQAELQRVAAQEGF